MKSINSFFVLLFFFSFSTTTFAKKSKPLAKCTQEAFFKALVVQDKEIKKGSAHTFSKTDQGDFWFWHEKRLIINPGISPEPGEFACMSPNLSINRWLSTKDIVKTPEDINGSTYLVDENWAAKAIYFAVMHGPTIRVTK